MAAARAKLKDSPQAPASFDAYFGMIVLALAASLVALVFLYMHFSEIKDQPKALQKTQVGQINAPAPIPGAPGGGGLDKK